MLKYKYDELFNPLLTVEDDMKITAFSMIRLKFPEYGV